jgi:cytoskeletal protein CcmA (bactofilin family)
MSERISPMAMWKQQPSSGPADSLPDHVRTNVPVPQTAGFTTRPPATTPATHPSAEQSVFPSGITIRGEISGPDAIYVDGIIEGEINIPGERVTVGPHGSVRSTLKTPCITAREIVVLGTVKGNLVATDRLEIRANGNVIGDVSTVRIKIEDGSIFQGGIDIRKAEPKPVEIDEVEQAQPSASHLEYAGAEI